MNEIPTSINLDNIGLNSGFMNVAEFDPYNLPSKNVSKHKLSRRDGNANNYRDLNSKMFNLSGQMLTNTAEESRDLRDAISTSYNKRNLLPLNIGYGDHIRTWLVEFNNLEIINAGQGLTYYEWIMALEAPDPAGTRTGALDFPVSRNITTGFDSHPIIVNGSYDALPHRFNITVNSMTNSNTEKFIEVGSNIDNAYLRFTFDVLPSTPFTLSFDSVHEVAYRDGILLDPEGVFPFWSPGSNNIVYQDNASARSVTLEGEYVRRYLS